MGSFSLIWFIVSCGIIVVLGGACSLQIRRLKSKLGEVKAENQKLEHRFKNVEEELAESSRKLEDSRIKMLEQKERLAELEYLDNLTGLYTTEYFYKQLNKEWKRAFRNKKPVSIVLVDIDYFKAFKDGYGPLETDRALKSVAQVIKKCAARPSDLVTRINREEFLVFLAETEEKGAIVVAEKIRKRIEALAIPNQYSPQDPFITVSIGAVTHSPNSHLVSENLVDEVYKALRRAKEYGRNRIHF
jgi:diguanylate cyclase (GGDEF)-like protein